MRYLTAIIFVIFSTIHTYSQTYEVGSFLGGSNFIGDVGNTAYVNPNSIAAGALFKWNRSKRHAFRGSIIYTKLEADDAKSNEPRRVQRDFKLSSNLIEASVGLEYSFWDWDLHSGKQQAVPYLYTGFSVLYSNKVFNNSGLDAQGLTLNYAIPMVIGFKATLGTHFVAGIELGARYTFSDNLDGSNPEEFSFSGTREPFGNNNTNDWYVFTGVTLTYTFGRKPCYCVF